MSEKTYSINEIFYSIQGEGVRQGTANVFIRFSGCNLQCDEGDAASGFMCDTEFTSGVKMTLDAILAAVTDLWPQNKTTRPNVIFTGGEPAMQLDQTLVNAMKMLDWYCAIETNGTRPLPKDLDWVCVSPKSAEHTLHVNDSHMMVDELKYVRNVGQGVPKPMLKATHYLISPAFNPDWKVSKETLQHCIELVKQNPKWRLSVQLHKIWGVR